MDFVKPGSRLAFLAFAGALAWACTAAEPEAESASSADTVAEQSAPSAASQPTAQAQRREGELEGQVVDVSCYLAQGLKGDAHRQCAEVCTNQLAIPLKILDDEGNLWHLVDDDMPGHDQSPTVVQFAEQRVRASGTLIEQGENKAIIVRNVALVEGTANPQALASSRDPELGRDFNTKPAAKP